MVLAQRPEVWILTDFRDGTNSQCVGVAQKLNPNFHTIDISELKNISTFVDSIIIKHSSMPAVLISASPEVLQQAIRIKQKAGSKIFNVKLGSVKNDDAQWFDLIARVDPPPPPTLSIRQNSKTMYTLGVPHKVTPELVEAGKRDWAEEFSGMGKPLIAVLLGGDTSNLSQFTPSMAKKMGHEINEYAERNNISLIVTNSRRTSPQATEAFFNEIKVPCYFYDRHKNGNNPYFGILGIADGFIVSGESMSMICEACSTGKPVYYYRLPEVELMLHPYLQSELERNAHVKKFDKGQIFESWTSPPLDVANEIASRIMSTISQNIAIRRM